MFVQVDVKQLAVNFGNLNNTRYSLIPEKYLEKEGVNEND
jgi:hypothetical protein